MLAHLPAFESPGFSPGEWRGGEMTASGARQMPWFELSQDARLFVRSLYEEGWVDPFEWSNWQAEAERIVTSDELENADITTIRRLLTLLVRKNRFVEGELGAAFESGLVVRILRRVRTLAERSEL
ncbi:MAG: DUF6508 domain-containing protein [Actinomycetota bacterium]|nr:DUF6508 domain-containing protein [Actinomycetota bacterium]